MLYSLPPRMAAAGAAPENVPPFVLAPRRRMLDDGMGGTRVVG